MRAGKREGRLARQYMRLCVPPMGPCGTPAWAPPWPMAGPILGPHGHMMGPSLSIPRRLGAHDGQSRQSRVYITTLAYYPRLRIGRLRFTQLRDTSLATRPTATAVHMLASSDIENASQFTDWPFRFHNNQFLPLSLCRYW
jgi:hypothetical protein